MPVNQGWNKAHNKPGFANVLNYHFSSVFTHDEEATLPDMGRSPYPSLPDIDINIAGVTNLLKEVNPYKAIGPDCTPAKLLKKMAEECPPSLTLIFTASLQQGNIPQDWKKALVMPIFKKGDQTNPTNYHPVSLTYLQQATGTHYPLKCHVSLMHVT